MSVIARQGFKYSLIGYFGFLLGTISAIFIFPYDMEFYGKLRFIMPTAEMLLPIVIFGLSFSNVKFFQQTQKEGKHQNLLSLSLAGILLNFAIFSILFFAFFLLFPQFKTLQLWKMKFLILPLILLMALSAVLNKYITNFKRIVVPNIFENLFPKIANLGAFTLFFFLGVSEKGSYGFFLGMFLLSLIGYFFYANKLEKFTPDFSTDYVRKDHLWKEILNYSFYGFLGNIGNFIAFRVDNYMIGEFLNFEENGVYSIILSILSFILIPQMGLFNISAPIINKTIAEGEFEELDRFHKKTSLTLFFLGAVLFSCILVGFPYLSNFIKNGEQLRQAEPVIWILGFAMLFDLATGFNGHIISLSKYYRFNIVIMLFLAITTITLNYLFLTKTHLGIIGIAMATAISLTLFNLTKIYFNYWKFKVFPLTIEMMYMLIICTLAITLAIMLPETNSNMINLLYKPGFVLTVIFGANHVMKIFPVEDYINKKFFKSIFKF
ncbi:MULTISPECIES: lipopolysaccharide biosynthesis protein [unclassified Kaistella]|uniref:lipopolysaccharide biosynthesis protein n=1 Tax=unclassified Kaistella TaxID=2762626 RepID=UPI002732EEC0|nr:MULTISPECIES: oligosaccharide flippase family protein [unclassified Kaistella]MDP2455200.1 oligosaccharide flippase family protein [Kaistella sp. SH11-4b]MDP2458174.1 oligosaccharide flippase family protein [Kaistella sp. SH40-3]MDP2460967.1 oligosaccharide flippase family protein [Kaistella sp. SH19-2b]